MKKIPGSAVDGKKVEGRARHRFLDFPSRSETFYENGFSRAEIAAEGESRVFRQNQGKFFGDSSHFFGRIGVDPGSQSVEKRVVRVFKTHGKSVYRKCS